MVLLVGKRRRYGVLQDFLDGGLEVRFNALQIPNYEVTPTPNKILNWE